MAVLPWEGVLVYGYDRALRNLLVRHGNDCFRIVPTIATEDQPCPDPLPRREHFRLILTAPECGTVGRIVQRVIPYA